MRGRETASSTAVRGALESTVGKRAASSPASQKMCAKILSSVFR